MNAKQRRLRDRLVKKMARRFAAACEHAATFVEETKPVEAAEMLRAVAKEVRDVTPTMNPGWYDPRLTEPEGN